ncbi:Ankyrin repeat and BTB/POZ domain-containing protein 1 [Nymphon striatum]|nr:Ankyrin repeat and BTB/POZ domain-containing protein 1 [Nymphon striatum]
MDRVSFMKPHIVFAFSKPGIKVKTILIESGQTSMPVHFDFNVLINQALPVHFRQWIDGSELPFLPTPDHIGFEDMCLIVDNYNFMCHQAFICSRSDYFKAMLRNHFLETEVSDENLRLMSIKLYEVPVKIFVNVLYYIYQDEVQLTEETAFETLCAADLYLLPGLKKKCAAFLVDGINVNNCIQLLKISMLFQLARLENQTIEFMAHHIFELLEMTEFEELVKEEARKVENREEIDSVPFIDDIRFYIRSRERTLSEINEAHDQLLEIDTLLEKLGLDG